MVVRIHEADGTPYEHVLDIREPEKRHEVPFNTKYKRVRHGAKRFGGRQLRAALAAAGDADAKADIELFDPSFDLPMWEDEAERQRWRVVDWNEDDITKMETATFEWIRVDAEFEWIARIVHEQPADQWISQLQSDRDVIAQLEVRFTRSFSFEKSSRLIAHRPYKPWAASHR
jgi:transcription initiation factor TFIID subunit 2